MKLCACGCDRALSKDKYTYAQGHEAKGSRRTGHVPKTCDCGCGERVSKPKYGYVFGHRHPGMVEAIRARVVVTPAGCWEFAGSKLPQGYGTIWNPDAHAKVYAHRAAYEAFVSPVPDGMFVCHHCDNPPCCNPEHLWLGTHTDNMRDMLAKGRAPHQRVACGAEVAGA